MRSIKPILLASALAFCAAIAAGAPASAAPVNGLTASIAAPQTSAAGLLPVEQVAQRRYNRNRHGHRHRARRGRHVHFYQGYWYAVPWWLGAAAVAAPYYAAPDYYDAEPSYAGGDHIQWCLNRYRSYNPRTDTFRGYDGLDHRCVSPYSY